jgi:hypothetical protein
VRRFLALVLAAALPLSAASSVSLHVHEYLDHEHPEHQHGIAAHDHRDARLLHSDPHTAANDDHPLSIEAGPCNAGSHAVGITIVGASLPDVRVDVAGLPGPALAGPRAPVRSALRITDIRVHGPPFLHRLAARAPPVSLPA